VTTVSVVPGCPFESRKHDNIDAAPRPSPLDELFLIKTVQRFRIPCYGPISGCKPRRGPGMSCWRRARMARCVNIRRCPRLRSRVVRRWPACRSSGPRRTTAWRCGRTRCSVAGAAVPGARVHLRSRHPARGKIDDERFSVLLRRRCRRPRTGWRPGNGSPTMT
jgi:hypothetical protein